MPSMRSRPGGGGHRVVAAEDLRQVGAMQAVRGPPRDVPRHPLAVDLFLAGEGPVVGTVAADQVAMQGRLVADLLGLEGEALASDGELGLVGGLLHEEDGGPALDEDPTGADADAVTVRAARPLRRLDAVESRPDEADEAQDLELVVFVGRFVEPCPWVIELAESIGAHLVKAWRVALHEHRRADVAPEPRPNQGRSQ